MPVKYDIEPRECINISMSTCNIFSHPPRVCAWPFQRVVPSARGATILLLYRSHRLISCHADRLSLCHIRSLLGNYCNLRSFAPAIFMDLPRTVSGKHLVTAIIRYHYYLLQIFLATCFVIVRRSQKDCCETGKRLAPF